MNIILKILSVLAFANLGQTQNADVNDIIYYGTMGDMEFFFRNKFPGVKECYELIKNDYKDTANNVVSSADYDGDSFTRLLSNKNQEPAKFIVANIKNLGTSILQYQKELEKFLNDADKAKETLLKYKSELNKHYSQYQKNLKALQKTSSDYKTVKNSMDGNVNNIVHYGKPNAAKFLECMKKKFCNQ